MAKSTTNFTWTIKCLNSTIFTMLFATIFGKLKKKAKTVY